MQTYYRTTTVPLQMRPDTMPQTAYKVLTYLQQLADYKTGKCYPKRSTIARACGCSVRTVSRCVAVLCKNGLIKSEAQYALFPGDNARRQTQNLYTVLDVSQVKKAAPAPARGPKRRAYYVPIVDRRPLGGNTLKVYNYLVLRAGKDGRCYCSKKRIAHDCALSVATVYRQLHRLEDLRLLKITRFRRAGSGVSAWNLFQIIRPSDLDASRLSYIERKTLLLIYLLGALAGQSSFSAALVKGDPIKIVSPRTHPIITPQKENRRFVLGKWRK